MVYSVHPQADGNPHVSDSLFYDSTVNVQSSCYFSDLAYTVFLMFVKLTCTKRGTSFQG